MLEKLKALVDEELQRLRDAPPRIAKCSAC